MVDYGAYNGDIVKKPKDSIDVNTNKSSSVIKRVVVKTYSESEIKPGPYVGYVLRVDKEDTPWYSVFSTEWSAKIRIPELDAHIPEPEKFGYPDDEKEMQKIEMHPTYIPKKDKDVPEPKEGARVLVEKDPNNQNNFVIEIIDTEGTSESPSPSGSRKSHKGGSSSGGSGGGGGPRRRNQEYDENGLTGFRRWKRRNPPDTIIIHESGTFTKNTLEHVLKIKNCGVHYAATQEAAHQFENPMEWAVAHTPNGWNNRSVAIEFNHPYASQSGMFKDRWIPLRWYEYRRYALPTMEALETLYTLTVHVTETTGIPFEIFQAKDGIYKFEPGWSKKNLKDFTGGIVCHNSASANHGDGHYPCLYMALRRMNHNQEEAFAIAEDLIKKTKHVYMKWELPVGTGSSIPARSIGGPPMIMPLTEDERKKFPKYP